MHIVIQSKDVGRASAASGSLGDFRRELSSSCEDLRKLSDVLDVFGADFILNLYFRQKYKLQDVDKRLHYAICIGVYLHLLSNY